MREKLLYIFSLCIKAVRFKLICNKLLACIVSLLRYALDGIYPHFFLLMFFWFGSPILDSWGSTVNQSFNDDARMAMIFNSPPSQEKLQPFFALSIVMHTDWFFPVYVNNFHSPICSNLHQSIRRFHRMHCIQTIVLSRFHGFIWTNYIFWMIFLVPLFSPLCKVQSYTSLYLVLLGAFLLLTKIISMQLTFSAMFRTISFILLCLFISSCDQQIEESHYDNYRPLRVTVSHVSFHYSIFNCIL